MAKLVSFFLIVSVVSLGQVGVFAQAKPSKQEVKATQVKEKIQKLGSGEKSIVKVTLYSGTTYLGHVGVVNDTDFTVVDKAGTSNTVRYSDVQKIGGKNLSTGAKIGIGVGIGAGAALLILWLILENYG